MYTPTLEQVKELAKEGNLIPVYREINADLETPVTAYMKVAKGPYSFLLESVEGGERLARFSIIGTEPSKVIRTGPGEPDGAVDPLRLIEKTLSQFKPVLIPGLPRFPLAAGSWRSPPSGSPRFPPPPSSGSPPPDPRRRARPRIR